MNLGYAFKMNATNFKREYRLLAVLWFCFILAVSNFVHFIPYFVLFCLILSTLSISSITSRAYELKCFNLVFFIFQILKPSEKKAKYQYQGLNQARPVTPRGPTGVPGMKRK